jgi:hypothetical protein
MRSNLLFASIALLSLSACGADDASSAQYPDGGVGGGGDGSVSGDGGTTGDGSAGGDGSANRDGGTTGDSGTVTPTVGGIFEKPEPWTEDVSALTKDARSDAIIAALVSLGGWGQGNQLQIDFSIPLFFADSNTPRKQITGASGYCYGGPDCDAVPLMMPVPSNANIEGVSGLTCNVAQDDCHILVLEKTQKKLYELYNSTAGGNGGIVALGAFVWDLTKAYPPNERGDQCTSADAAGFPIAGLLPTADEVAAGEVKHAIRFILPNQRMKNKAYVHPASHAGAPSSSNANAPPYGVRFRLKASFDESSFNAGEKVILKAMKTYGMLLSDGGNVALTFADDRTTTAKWSTVGVSATSFSAIKVDSFEVVDLSAEIAQTNDCVRNP